MGAGISPALGKREGSVRTLTEQSSASGSYQGPTLKLRETVSGNGIESLERLTAPSHASLPKRQVPPASTACAAHTLPSLGNEGSRPEWLPILRDSL